MRYFQSRQIVRRRQKYPLVWFPESCGKSSLDMSLPSRCLTNDTQQWLKFEPRLIKKNPGQHVGTSNTARSLDTAQGSHLAAPTTPSLPVERRQLSVAQIQPQMTSSKTKMVSTMLAVTFVTCVFETGLIFCVVVRMVKFRRRMEGNSSVVRKQAGKQDQLPYLERKEELAKAKWHEIEAEGRRYEIGGHDTILEISVEPDRRIGHAVRQELAGEEFSKELGTLK